MLVLPNATKVFPIVQRHVGNWKSWGFARVHSWIVGVGFSKTVLQTDPELDLLLQFPTAVYFGQAVVVHYSMVPESLELVQVEVEVVPFE